LFCCSNLSASKKNNDFSLGGKLRSIYIDSVHVATYHKAKQNWWKKSEIKKFIFNHARGALVTHKTARPSHIKGSLSKSMIYSFHPKKKTQWEKTRDLKQVWSKIYTDMEVTVFPFQLKNESTGNWTKLWNATYQ